MTSHLSLCSAQYMAPEMYANIGYGTSVDIWAVGLVAYFVLCGDLAFDGEDAEEVREAITTGTWAFEPVDHWEAVPEPAKDFIRACLTLDPFSRPTAEEARMHAWIHNLGAS